MEPEIAPLAKRLAEENNVNWRALSGSGANGRILERDVLEYLARVMAGEEDINPTAEPLPEGLDAWPEDDVKTYYGVDTSAESSDFTPDIDDASLFVDSVESSAVALEPLGDDIFLVDEGDLSVAPAAHHEPLVYDSSLDNLDDDVMDVYGALTLEDGDAEPSAETFDTPTLESFEEPLNEGLEDIDMDVFGQGESPVERESAFETDPVFEAEHTPTQSFADTEALFVEEVEPVSDAFASLIDEGNQDSFEDVVMEALGSVESEVIEGDHDMFGTTPTMEDLEPIAAEIPEESGEVYVYDATDDETPSLQTQKVYVDDIALEEPVAAEVVSSTDSQATFVEATLEEPMPASTTPEEVSASVWSDIEPVSTPIEPAHIPVEPSHTPGVDSFAPVATLATGVALGAIQNVGDNLSTHDLPLVTYGILLRRHVDLSTLIQAQHAVAEEVGYEDPQILTCFLLRAASKALHKVPLVQGSVGLASIREHGVGIIEMPEASSAPFRGMLNKTQQALGSSLRDSVALAVADMSGFDIDEAVLNVGVPVLTLGRMMYDNGKGTHHSTLSISGNVSVESGTKFLSAVAELLNSPVRLVV